MKERLDVLLVKRNLAESREKAKAIIMAGNILVNGEREDKAGTMFPETVEITVKGTPLKYVSRGGYKLEKSILLWNLELSDKICMDVGSSTGGFTDCMLQNGACKVYAIDVGTNQLSWKLRQNEKVISMEKTNIRYLKPEDIVDKIDFTSVDVSFISLKKVLEPIFHLQNHSAQMVCLIKPQFEAGREKIGKKGVVKDAKVHLQVVREIVSYAISIGYHLLGISYSPIKGPEGNIEYLVYLEKRKDSQVSNEIDIDLEIESAVLEAHSNLNC